MSSGYISTTPPIPPAIGGWPVYRIESVASKGNFRTQRNVLEVTRTTYNYNVRGGISASGNLVMGGASTIDGRTQNVNGALCSTNPTPACSVPFPTSRAQNPRLTLAV